MTAVEASASPAAADPLYALTAALVESNDRLGALLALTEVDAGSLDEDESLTALLHAAVELTGSDGGSITARATHIVGTAKVAGQHEWTVERPISDGNNLRLELWRAEPYRTPSQKLLLGVANLARSAVRTAEMHRATVRNELTKQEHATAARLVTAALPPEDAPPVVDRVTAFARSIPARLAGGDLFSWLEIDGNLWFAVGDVSGKGLPAAVQMSTAVLAIDNAMRRHADQSPVEVHVEVASWMHNRLSDAAMFLTLVIGKWQPTLRRLEVANAGHSPILFVADGVAERIAATVPPIGVLEDTAADLWSRNVGPGAVLALGSDGLTEETDPHGVMFGERRFDEEVVQAAAAVPNASGIGARVLRKVESHAQGSEPADDRTLMILRFDP